MSYLEKELSTELGEPYFLYLFDDGVTQERISTQPDTIERFSDQWYPSPVSHGDVEQSGNIEKQELVLTFPLSDRIGQSYLLPAANITTVTVWRGHRNDIALDDLKVYWKGRIVGAKSSPRKIEVVVESVFTSLRRPGLRARFSRQCRHAHYNDGCLLNRADFEIPALVTGVVGTTLTVPEAGGSTEAFEYTAGIVNYRGALGFIASHVGEQLILTLPIAGLEEHLKNFGAAEVLIAPGCNRSEPRCNDRYDNGLNHGGFHRFPELNPFETSLA